MRFAWVLLCLLPAACSRPAEPPVLWLGHLAPLSGPRRERGEDAARAIELLVERSRADGHSVAVRHVDAETKATARAEAGRLLAVNRVLALLAGPGLEDADDVAAAAAAHDAVAVVLEPDPDWRGRALASFVFDKLMVRSVRIDPQRQPRVAAGFAAAWRESGGAVSDRDAAVLADGRFTLNDSAYEAVTFADHKGLPEAAREWSARYQGRYHQPPTGDALVAHDGLGIILAALAELDSPPTRPKLQDALSRMTTHAGLTGTLRRAGGRWRWPLLIVRHRAGKAEVVETVPVPER